MPTNFCPECGTKAVPGQKFCGECGARFTGTDERTADSGQRAGDGVLPQPSSQPAHPASSSRTNRAEAADSAVITRSDVETRSTLKDTVVSRSTVRAGGPIEDSVVSRSDIQTKNAGIRDTVISHSTITQTETHQHFGESVGTYEAQMDLGRTAFEGKNWDEAVDFFNTALKIDSRSHEPWFLKGMSCAELRRTDEAVTNLRRSLKLAGERCAPLLSDIKSLSDRVARAGRLQEDSANELIGKASAELQRSTAVQSQARTEKDKGLAGALALDIFVLPGLGSSMRTNQVVEGMEKRQAADKHEAEGRRLEEQAKNCASEAVKLYNSAIRFCDLVLEFEKQDEYSLLKRGELYYRLRLYDDACRSYESLLAFNPGHRDALRMRGMCFTAQGKRIPPPPGTVPAPEPAAGLPPEGPQGPLIPQPVPTAQPQVAPLQQSLQGRPAQPAYPVQPAPQQPVQAAPPQYAVQPGARTPPGPAPGYPVRPGAYQAPAQPGPPAPAQPARANPCPFCRGEMSFVKERGVWQCVSCRQFSARPAR